MELHVVSPFERQDPPSTYLFGACPWGLCLSFETRSLSPFTLEDESGPEEW